MTIRPSTVTSVPDAAVAGMTPLRFTVDIAAMPSRTIASVAVIDGTDGAIYSGGLVLLPAVSQQNVFKRPHIAKIRD